MKDFFKFTLASFLGFSVGVVILILIGLSIIGAIIASTETPIKVKDNSILSITLDKRLTDRESDNPFKNFNPYTGKAQSTIGLNQILDNIEKAKSDDNIKGIYLNISYISSNFGGYATIEEIRNKLLDFKDSGKFIVSYNNMGYSQKSYYLCSVADSIFINPKANILMLGMGGEMSFYKRLFKKIGIEPQIIRHGKYKAAIEPFMLEKMSDANREQTMKYIETMWNHILTDISRERHVSTEQIDSLTDNFALRKPEIALKYNLIDGIIYEDEMIEKLKRLSGLKEAQELRLVENKKYSKVQVIRGEMVKDKIAVIYATGQIGQNQSWESIGPELTESIRKARRDSSIKAIVLRVNSPGGSALVSELIWREVQLASQSKPVVASLGNVAASGGYYIACAADTIVADPNTITGSIGIFGIFFNGKELFNDKIGITTDAFGTNKLSNFGGGSPVPFMPISSRKFTKTEQSILQDFIEEGYDTFITRVADGRNMSKENVDKIGQGRVWNGINAREIGLVDVLGGMDRALKLAKDMAGLDKYRIISLPKEKDPIQQLIEELTGEVKLQILRGELGVNYKYYKQTKEVIDLAGIQARIPYRIELH